VIERSDGQATIEAALTLPIVLIALLLIVQVGIVVRDAVALVQTAREGARAASVTGSDDDMRRAIVRSAGPLASDRIVVAVSPSEPDRKKGDAVTVTLSYTERLAIPIVSRIVSMDLPLHASATTRQERTLPTASPTP
jgi:Flp pilus assembly protein TadG